MIIKKYTIALRTCDSLSSVDMPAAANPLILSLPSLPSCELTDPHDDITLPRLIEALKNRQRVKQMLIEDCSKTGVCSHFSSPDTFWLWRISFGIVFFLLAHISLDVISANMIKSVLQELDTGLISKDNFIQEQNGKLLEKDRIIQGNKAEIERLEKKSKMQEHKVGVNGLIHAADLKVVTFFFSYVSHVSVSDWHPAENN